MPILKNAKHEKFCQLIARGDNATTAYIKAGYSKGGAPASASKLLRNQKVKIRIPEIQAKVNAKVEAKSISIKANRIAVLNEMWEKLRQIVRERAEDPAVMGVAGGTTGLIVHDLKGVGTGPAADVVDVYEVDVALLKEMREHSKQAAIEMGQWVEKGELSGPMGGPMLFAIDGVTGAEWLHQPK